MPLIDHVVLTITSDSVGVSRAGFGVPLIVGYNMTGWTERVRSYNSLADVDADFATTDVEYLCAQAIFSQSPKPTVIKIGKGLLPPTQVYRITPTAVHSAVYTVTCAGEGFTTADATYPADTATTVAEITAGLTTALNAVAGGNFTAVDDATHITVTGDAAANWFSLEVGDLALMEIDQRHADPGLATDLAAIALEDSDWYCLLTNYNSNAMVDAAADWVETQKKIYLFDVNDSDSVTTAQGNSDTLDDLFTAARDRSAGSYHPSPVDFFSAAWAGAVLPLEPGSETWKFKQLSGPAPVTLTATHRDNLVDRNANFYQTVADLNITAEGTMSSGEFIDVIRGLDWLDDDMTKAVFEVLAGANKVPYTDLGVAMIKGAVTGSLKLAVQKGILAADPVPTVTAPLVADVSTANKTARILPDVKFTGTLAGAIHKVLIDGVVSV